MNKVLKKIFDVVFWLMIIGIIGFSIIFIKSGKSGEQKPIFGRTFYTILSGSMEPTIHTGSLIMDKKVEIDELKVGDVITFKVPESGVIVTHRIHDVIKTDDAIEFETKGDANNAVDLAHVKSENVIGEVQKVMPKTGKFIQSIKSIFK